jgi:hypothetical protein
MDADDDFLNAFAGRWLDAWNSHETERVLDLLADDVVWEDLTFWPEVIHGREGVREYVDHIWRAMPDVTFEERGRFFAPGARSGIVLFQQRGSAPPALGDRPGFDSHGCDVFLAFTGDRLAHYLASYDIVPMLGQMGLLPDRAGRRGGAYLLSLAGQRA